MGNFRRQWNLDCIAITKILKCFRTNECRKWRNRFKIERFVVLAQYLKQQVDWSRYKRNFRQSKKSISWSRFYLSFTFTLPVGHVISERYFWFYWNYKQLRIEVKNSMSKFEIYFPLFSEIIHAIFKIFSGFHAFIVIRLKANEVDFLIWKFMWVFHLTRALVIVVKGFQKGFLCSFTTKYVLFPVASN